jgi:hypothetical protein
MRRSPGKVLLVAALGLLLIAAGVAVGKKKHHHRKLPRGPYPSLGGCPVFPASSAAATAPSAADQSAWNQDVSAAPVDPNSGAYISYIEAHGGHFVHPDFASRRISGFPYAVVGRKQKRTKVHFTAYGDESDHGTYRVPLKAMVEGGQTSDGDRHVLAVDAARCKLYELYRAFARKHRRPHWNADSAAIFDLRSAGLRHEGFTSADAAGLSIFAGLARYDEAAAGHINHAIRVTVESTQNSWINPATHCAGDTSSASAPPMGLRLRLSAGYDISGLTGPAHVIAAAMKQFGVIVADNGSNWAISGTSDRRWPDDNLEQLKSIPGSAFQAVQSAAAIHHC